MALDEFSTEHEDKAEKFSSRVTYVLSFILATLACVWFYVEKPPDDPATQRMRMFFKRDVNTVMEFIKLPPEKLKAFAENQKHPFYKRYAETSMLEKENIKALIHISTDYTPNQYWFNLVFQWLILFTLALFIGKMTEACLVLMRNEQARRIKKRRDGE